MEQQLQTPTTLNSAPAFWDSNSWPSIGPEFTLGSGNIPAQNRFNANTPVMPLTGCPAIVTGAINGNPALDYTVFPNPFTDKITIKSKTQLITVEIYDLLGRLLLSKQNTNQINLSFLEKGVYIITICTTRGTESTKLIKLN